VGEDKGERVFASIGLGQNLTLTSPLPSRERKMELMRLARVGLSNYESGAWNLFRV